MAMDYSFLKFFLRLFLKLKERSNYENAVPSEGKRKIRRKVFTINRQTSRGYNDSAL